MTGRYERELSVLAEITDHVSAEARKLMINIDRRVVMETPFDTGSAKRSWLAGVNQSPTGLFNLPDDYDVSLAEAQAIEQGASTINGAKGFDTIYIVNNQPYIKRLNEGWSEQQQSPGYIDSIIAQEVAAS